MLSLWNPVEALMLKPVFHLVVTFGFSLIENNIAESVGFFFFFDLRLDLESGKKHFFYYALRWKF